MKYQKISRVLAVLCMASLGAGVYADDMVSGYLTSSSGKLVLDGDGDCVRVPSQPTDKKLTECGYPAPVVAAEPPPAAKVEMVVAPTAATITKKIEEKISIAAAMLFGFDSAELSEDAKAVIDERIQRFQGRARLTSHMRIEGHTDSSGPEAYNQKLSERRAQAVADYIASQSYNVRAEDIEVIGKGESEPIASNSTREGRAKNRRVDIYAEGVITQ